MQSQMGQMWTTWAQKFGRKSRDEINRRRRSSFVTAGLMALTAAVIGKFVSNRRTPEMAATAS